MALWESVLDGISVLKAGYEIGQMNELLGEWLMMDIERAKTQIVHFVRTSSTSQIDMMDHMFIHGTLSYALAGKRPQLMICYTWFKFQELARFQEFRGFPRVD